MILFYIVTGSLVYITQEKTDKQHRAIILIYRGTRTNHYVLLFLESRQNWRHRLESVQDVVLSWLCVR